MSAVHVVQLRKEFTRRKRPPVVALDDVSFSIARGECVAVLGQNGSGKSTLVRLLSTLLLPDGGSARVFGHDVVRDERAVRGVVNRVSVEASFFKRMSATENLSYAARFYGIGPPRDAPADPGDPRARRLPGRPRVGADGGPLARHAAEGRARAGAADVADAAAARRADHGPRPARQARGAGLHRRDAPASTTRRRCCARTTWPRRRRSPTASGSSTAAGCSRSSRRPRSSAATRADTLEAAFIAATGREFEDEEKQRRRRNGRASRLQAIALAGVVERNAYLVKRYGLWELAFFVWTSRTRSRSCSSPTASRRPAARSTSSARRRSC